jgi:hypothetical protein
LPLPEPNAPRQDALPFLIEAAAYIAWYQVTAAALAANPAALPTLYQVWVRRPGSQGPAHDAKLGRAAYFEAGGEHYSVFASLTPTIVARQLPSGWLREKLLPAQKHSTGYVQATIPRLEDQLPGSTLRPANADGDIPITASGFEALFLGTDVELEAAPFVAVFARELHELGAAAAHAAGCGRALRLHHF